MSYENIPQELRDLPQWICWRLEDIGAAKPTKVPYDPKSGKRAAVDDPDSWCDFATAAKASSKYSGIGFVFTSNDPYCFVDLDDTNGDKTKTDRQIEIFKELKSYSEISPSGNGLHVIIKASVIAGRKRDFIEIYSTLRYATFTGIVYNPAPIADRQEEITRIWEQLGAAPLTFNTAGIDKLEVQTDSEVISQAEKAANGEKFKALFRGDWNTTYPSQSEADIALVDIIAFYTQNRKQIARIFRLSELGKREKAKRDDYLTYMVNKSFDQQLPQVDIDGFQVAIQTKIAEQQNLPLDEKQPKKKKQKQETTKDPVALTLPPGLMGEIAQFIFAISPLPVPEIALAGAIGLMCGIAGRAYNISGEGLNQYVLLVAKTGRGKEAMAIGIDRLLEVVKLQVPTASGVVGPAEISSGEALLKHLNKNPCFVSILGEFGYRLQTWSGQNNPAITNLRRMILDLYHKSGYGRVFRPKIYSDKDKNIEETISPCFSILGETTPKSFYDYIDERMLEDGLLPRFVIIEYAGPRVDFNKQRENVYPPNWLVDKLSTYIANCETLSFNKKVINVKVSPEARSMLDAYEKNAQTEINTNDDITADLWNRAHLKVLKLSALVATGVQPYEPVIMPEYVSWAIGIVKNNFDSIKDKFDTGVVGANQTEVKQGSDIIRVIKDYLLSDWDETEKYARNGKGGKEKVLFDNKIVPWVYLQRRLVSAASFRADRMGPSFALKRAVQGLLDADKIREIPKADLAIKFGTTQRAFMLTDLRELEQ